MKETILITGEMVKVCKFIQMENSLKASLTMIKELAEEK
jgi:hypothetical protein